VSGSSSDAALDRVLPLVRGARVDHVAVAVRSLWDGAALYRDTLGGAFVFGAEVTDQAFRMVQYRLPGGGKFELVTPMGEGFVSRFLETRGEGVHHVTLRIERIEEQLERLRAGGVELTLVNLDSPTWKEAFIHPRVAHGVLIQLAESPYTEEETAAHMRDRFSEAALLAG